MKFLVDAQLPRRLADWLRTQSFDAIHTLDMPAVNATSDKDIVDRADREGRVVVTKDDDFVRSFIVSGRPLRLLLISTGNIRNDDLEALIAANIRQIADVLSSARFIELSRNELTIHE
uniref:Predicted nuclease, contains PIN domain, potential toxin-antitoxin system component n=1 Tax=Candidatus Kentrum sp. SD TaxID=2126332 RepID=A0A450Z3L2_9GAMM|nr:MAG: Predicted nuclease, contains PIN domain, potential toxin-antitoxin system component [Candidatus Kentron sp. SD]VFK48393.1 MAG: Predicted nuclease, contains PIN domain, potential toxin-antitoxin system component [Candidatus Kentron sp. SD]VFK80478.1 MAG: Predicted nuclease, contains PIN domain, potential toxin-antitoxin system component [Candidatus Kentron sp. SD]